MEIFGYKKTFHIFAGVCRSLAQRPTLSFSSRFIRKPPCCVRFYNPSIIMRFASSTTDVRMESR